MPEEIFKAVTRENIVIIEIEHGLGIFLASFIAVLFYVFVGLRDKRKLSYLAQLPLELDTSESTQSGNSHSAEGVDQT